MRDKKFLKDFMTEVNEEVYELVKLMCMKNGLSEDVVFMFILGAYEDDEEESLNVSLSASVENEDEFEQLISTAIDIYNVATEDQTNPEKNTIDWWINKYGNGSIN